MTDDSDGGQDRRSEQDILAELFSAPLSEFISLRKAAATELRKGGQRDASARIKALAKPTPAAWAANALYRDERKLWDDAMASSEALRSAQQRGGLTAQEMQRHVQTQRAALTALMRRAANVADAGRQTLNRSQEGRLRTSLEALCAGAEGTAGQLSTDLSPPSFDGFGAAGFQPQMPVVPTPTPPPAPQPARATSAATTATTAAAPSVAKTAAAPAVAKTGAAPAVAKTAAAPAVPRGRRSTTPTVTPRDRERAHALQRLRELESIRDARDAQRRKAQAAVSTSTDDLERARADVAVAGRRLERARQDANTAEAQLERAKSQQRELTQSVKQAQAAISQANAALTDSGE